jgi:hypothetical protein
MVGSERWQCIGMTRGGEACSRVVAFSADLLLSGHQPLCHQHLREVEEGLQREHLGTAAPSLAQGLRRCAAVGKLTDDRAVRCGKPAPCLSLRGGGTVVLAQRLCDEHRSSLTQALIRQWQEEQSAAGATGASTRRWGWQLGVRPG